MHRTVRIPLRGEQNTVYVATERQLRAIMGSQNGSESNNRFYDAYHEVIQTNNQGKNVKICADIDLSSANFTPISGYQLNVAASDNDLSCGFDGSNCAITGMRINQPGSDNVGMFSLVGNTSASVKIQNIILCDVSVTGQDYVGALIGRAGSSNDVYDKAMVVNCKVITSTEGESTVTGRNYVGGLIGYANGVSLNHKKTNSAPERVDGVCGSNATVLSTGYCVGGLIGKMDHVKVYNCYATGEVALQSTDPIAGQLSAGFGNQAVGGFVGTVEHAFAFGNVSATVQRVGGAATSFGVGGFAGSSQIAISDCFSSGDVACSVSNYYTNENSLRHGIGGLVGLTTAAVSNSYSSSAVSLTCDSPGTIGSLTTIGVGGVVGYSYSTVTNVYSSGNVSAPITNGGSSQNWIGGAAGFVSSTASHAYFDTWTNADLR